MQHLQHELAGVGVNDPHRQLLPFREPRRQLRGHEDAGQRDDPPPALGRRGGHADGQLAARAQLELPEQGSGSDLTDDGCDFHLNFGG